VEPPGPEDRSPSPNETYTRRVCAILLGDVFGYSALMGEDDERTARAIHALQAAIRDIVSNAHGRADPFAGDAILVTFDSVVAAVDAALAIQRRVAAEEFAGTRLQMRIGVHFGDVLVREGAAFGDAINIAARLQTLAKPGTVCISEGVCRQVRNRLDRKSVV
jgi:adenylate cyclase